MNSQIESRLTVGIESLKKNMNRASIIRLLESIEYLIESMQDNYLQQDIDLYHYINSKIYALNSKLSLQIDEVIHHSSFNQLESRWLGLYQTIMNADSNPLVKYMLFEVDYKEIDRDLTRVVEFDQSKIFDLIYSKQIGTYGGDPVSVIIIDREFGSDNKSVDIIGRLAGIAAASHAPMFCTSSPSMFNIEDFSQINNARDISKLFQVVSKMSWMSFRNSEDSRYVGMIAPSKILARAPISIENNPADGIDYNESVDPNNRNDYVWKSSVYLLLDLMIRSYNKYGTHSNCIGVSNSGGVVEDLPVHVYIKKEGFLAMKCPTEAAITERRERELNKQGFIVICNAKSTNRCVVFSLPSCNLPKVYNTPNANTNSQLSASLIYLFIASRFAHYLISICRDKIGSMETKESMESYLQRWMADYISLNPTASQETKIKKPLRSAKISLEEQPGKVGQYRIIVYVAPHMALSEVDISIRLVGKIPQK